MSKPKVLVAMSGGVDSSVAAGLLQEQGFEVLGATIKLWPNYIEPVNEGGCCSLSAVEDARRVAARLDIPFYVFNMQAEFQAQVIDRFIHEYARGRTPNPCIQCNRSIKFGHLLKMADKLGVEYLSTGHYARITRDDAQEYHLLQGLDANKDQSYTLYGLSQEQLARIILPLGDYKKPDIRQLAVEYGLMIADKPDSQEICFIPDNDYKGFLLTHGGLSDQPGQIVDQQGNVLGTHPGIFHFTIGQRKGLGLATGSPLYVVDILPATNTIVVGESQDIFWRTLTARDFHWISSVAPNSSFLAQAKIRYSASPAPAHIHPGIDEVIVEFCEPQRAVTPGQSAVIYNGAEVLGGGIIYSRKLS